MLIVVVGIGSFALGSLSRGSSIERPKIVIQAEVDKEEINEEVVASAEGSRYHYPWCSGAQRISERNKVTFASIDEAKAAGYTPALNCKGLK